MVTWSTRRLISVIGVVVLLLSVAQGPLTQAFAMNQTANAVEVFSARPDRPEASPDPTPSSAGQSQRDRSSDDGGSVPSEQPVQPSESGAPSPVEVPSAEAASSAPLMMTQGNGGPPGNNGTIKINGEEVGNGGGGNEPHVGCIFSVEFIGFDKGSNPATITFSAQQPSGSGDLLTDTVNLSTGNASQSFDLSGYLGGLERHPNQGYHIKVEIAQDGIPGNGKKSKVFWVDCGEPEPDPGDLKITKKLEDGKPSSSVSFEFTVTGPEERSTAVSINTNNTQNSVTLEDLAPGIYTVCEVPASGYTVVGELCQTVEVKSNEIAKVTFKNKKAPEYSTIEIVKTIDTPAPAGGVTFTFTINDEWDDYTVTITIPEGETTGSVSQTHLKPDIWHKVCEQAHSDYTVVGDACTWIKTKRSKTSTVNFTNQKINTQDASIKVKKEAYVDGSPVSGAGFTFAIYEGSCPASGSPIGTGTTATFGAGNTGYVTFSDLERNTWYCVVETGHGDFMPDAQAQSIKTGSTKNSEKKVTFKNRKTTPPTGELTITKNITGGTPDENVTFEFTISGPDGQESVTITVPAENVSASVSVPGLPTGTYTVCEVNIPEGYTLAGETDENGCIEVTVETDGASVTFTNAKNPPPTVEVVLTKTATFDGETVSPAGFTFAIYAGACPATDAALQTLTTDDSGIVTFTDLAPDTTYCVVETDSGDFTPDAEAKTVTTNGADEAAATVAFTNTQTTPTGDLQIVKNVTEAVSEDVTFTFSFEGEDDEPVLLASDTTTVLVTADSTGNSTTITGLTEGAYRVCEIDIPDGYELVEINGQAPNDDGCVTIEIVAGQTITVTFTNQPVEEPSEEASPSAEASPSEEASPSAEASPSEEASPSAEASPSQTASPTPSPSPSSEPSDEPSETPSPSPTEGGVIESPSPSADPTTEPSAAPSIAPSSAPSTSPVPSPTEGGVIESPPPSPDPTQAPTAAPTSAPTTGPDSDPSGAPPPVVGGVIEAPDGTIVEALPNTGAGQIPSSGNPLTIWLTMAVAVVGALMVAMSLRQRLTRRP